MCFYVTLSKLANQWENIYARDPRGKWIPHNNPICLDVVRHESFEVDIRDTVLHHDNNLIIFKNDMSLGIHRLHIT